MSTKQDETQQDDSAAAREDQDVQRESTTANDSQKESKREESTAQSKPRNQKILIGSQRDHADPELKNRPLRGDATLTPERVSSAIHESSSPQDSSTVQDQSDAQPPPVPTPSAEPSTEKASEESASSEPVPVQVGDSTAAPDADATAAPAAPTTPETDESEAATESITDPSDVDAELEAALGDLEMDSLMSGKHQVGDELEINSRVKGLVTRIHNDNVFFSIKGRFEGFASKRQFKTPPEEGSMLDVIVKNYQEEEGLYEVAIPGAATSVADWSDLEEGAIVEARVTGSNTGGLECTVNNIRGFIPASQIDVVRVENFGDYTNQKLQCVVTEVNPRRKKLVLSRRAVLEREKEEKKKELMKTLEAGQTHEGVVTKLMDFGAFIDIGGVEGLVHVSKLSWDRVAHPKDVLSPGQRISVKIEKINPDTGKISLSYRDTQENPWTNIEQKYPVGAVVEGTVTRLAQFGAFVKLEPGVEGLVHISELAHHRVIAVKNVVKQGDQVQVKVLSVDPEAQKIGLSLKATQAKPEKPKSGKKDDPSEQEPIRESAVKRREEPLKGGRDRSSGGEQFGLNW